MAGVHISTTNKGLLNKEKTFTTVTKLEHQASCIVYTGINKTDNQSFSSYSLLDVWTQKWVRGN